MSGLLKTIQDETAAHLAADERLSGVAILTEAKGNVVAEIEKAIAKLGICCVVLTPDAQVRGGSSPGPYLSPINVVVEVSENVLINNGPTGTKLPASVLAENVLEILHEANRLLQDPPLPPSQYPLTGTRIRLVPESSDLTYHVVFATAGTLGVPGAEPLA
jgi:hypothetical protein